MAYNIKSVLQNEGMKIFLLILWLIGNAVMFHLAYEKYCGGIQFFYLRQILGESMCISRATAFLLYLNCFLVLLPICKSLLTWLRVHIQKHVKGAHRRLFNHNHKFHIIIGISIVVFSLIHTFSHCANCYRFYINYSDIPELNVSPKKEKINAVLFLTKLPVYTGIAMLAILAILVFGSLPPVRRSRYEIFWYSHHLSIAFFAFLAVHGFGGIVKYQTNVEDHYPGCEHMIRLNYSSYDKKCEGKPQFAPDPPQAWKWIIAALLLYAIEKIVRFFTARKPVQVTKAIFHPGDVLELRMRKKGFSALPGQFVRLNCPDIAKIEWHPFTLTECPTDDDEEFALHVKVAGDWTELLASQLQTMVIVNKCASRIGDSWTISIEDLSSGVAAVPLDTSVLRLQVDGPYGSPFQDVSNFSVAFIITAGIGVTPFAALLNQMRYTMKRSKSYGKLKRLYFLWVCKTLDDFSWFLDILYRTNKQMNSEQIEEEMITTSLFVTRSTKLSELDPSLFDKKRHWLTERLQYRRPNWKDEFDQIDSQNERERIGVFFCGPKTIHPTLHKISNTKSKNNNTFIFHKESF